MYIITKIEDMNTGKQLTQYNTKYSWVMLTLFDIDTKESRPVICNKMAFDNVEEVMGYCKETETWHQISYQEYLLSTCIEYLGVEYDAKLDNLEGYLGKFIDGIYGTKAYPTVMNYIMFLTKYKSGFLKLEDNILYVYILGSVSQLLLYKYRVTNKKLFSKVLLLS